MGVHARPRPPEMLSDARNAVPCSQAKISRDAGADADGDAMRCGAAMRCDATYGGASCTGVIVAGGFGLI